MTRRSSSDRLSPAQGTDPGFSVISLGPLPPTPISCACQPNFWQLVNDYDELFLFCKKYSWDSFNSWNTEIGETLCSQLAWNLSFMPHSRNGSQDVGAVLFGITAYLYLSPSLPVCSSVSHGASCPVQPERKGCPNCYAHAPFAFCMSKQKATKEVCPFNSSNSIPPLPFNANFH